MTTMTDQFKGLPMEDLIGGPLIAAIKAQLILANSTETFIKNVGFLGPKTAENADQCGDIRTAKFKFDRPAGVAGTDGVVPTESVELDVPLLSIVKIPTLSISTVDLIFEMEVKNAESTKEKDTIGAEVSGGWASIKISGSISSSKESARLTDSSAKYHVEVHAIDSGMPEGLARVLDIMNSAIAPKKITAYPTKVQQGAN
ncbi:Protein of unknown function [Azotobacter beijerinckii]|uniref:DUF2589 domain-containing protein n=1 Tax=Azotobacter beijerinckii TaxID=170623 RepID=A0A1H6Z513_9GAMM|nr:DUF2589 domain-containing protein [Azotobacter beijerinckii]SEJ48643.1 Protein of unknown function [Azotobacter beijerinckii]